MDIKVEFITSDSKIFGVLRKNGFTPIRTSNGYSVSVPVNGLLLLYTILKANGLE